MIKGEVAEAASSLVPLWAALAKGREGVDVPGLHSTSIELADRFPLSETVSKLLHHATVAYARTGDLPSATATAMRMVSVWRARCQTDPNDHALAQHAHALDTLAGTYRARGMDRQVASCLVELVEWHLTCGNNAGVAWALRELGAIAFCAGDLDNAAAKFARADEMYAGDAEIAEIARERAECHVLIGRLSYRRNEPETAMRWFDRALAHLTDDAAEEVRGFIRAVDAGTRLPESELFPLRAFGSPMG